MELERNEHWLDRPLMAYKNVVKNNKVRAKTIKKDLSSKPFGKKVYKLLEKAMKLLTNFQNTLEKSQKMKKSKRKDFRNNLYLSIKTQGKASLSCTRSRLAKEADSLSQTVLATLKSHLKHDAHCIRNLMKSFMSLFVNTYTEILTSDNLSKIYEDTCRITSGSYQQETGSMQGLNYSMLDDFDLFCVVEKCFYDLNSVLNILVDSFPLFYSGLIDRNCFILIKEQLFNFVVSEFVCQEASDILLTLSRVMTFHHEAKLAECVKNSSGESFVGDNKLSLLEDLYNQINPQFRVVDFSNSQRSFSESLCYESKEHLINQSGLEQESEISQSGFIQLKYENAAEKLSSINFCRSPLEKVYMLKWVTESIKADGQVLVENSGKRLNICADTLISIYAYISVLSRNHLLYAHLFMAKRLGSEELSVHSVEAYNLGVLEASLSLLCDYQEKVSELMVSILQFESGQEVEEKAEAYHESLCETASTPKGYQRARDSEKLIVLITEESDPADYIG